MEMGYILLKTGLSIMVGAYPLLWLAVGMDPI
jgi:hypothetical protein